MDFTPSSGNKIIKCNLYKLGNGSGYANVIYDTQIIPILIDDIDGKDGKNAVQYYTSVRYATSDSPSSYTDIPTADTTYIRVAIITSSTPPLASDDSWNWSKYVGVNGYNPATKYIYARLETAPTTASFSSEYNFSTDNITNLPSYWSLNILSYGIM